MGLTLLIVAVTATGRPIDLGPILGRYHRVGYPAGDASVPSVRPVSAASARRRLRAGPRGTRLPAHVAPERRMERSAGRVLPHRRALRVVHPSRLRRIDRGAGPAFRRLLCGCSRSAVPSRRASPSGSSTTLPCSRPGMIDLGEEIKTRVVGTFYNANFYAEYLAADGRCRSRAAAHRNGAGDGSSRARSVYWVSLRSS